MIRWRLYRRTSSIVRSSAGSTRGGRDTSCSSVLDSGPAQAGVRLVNSLARRTIPAAGRAVAPDGVRGGADPTEGRAHQEGRTWWRGGPGGRPGPGDGRRFLGG